MQRRSLNMRKKDVNMYNLLFRVRIPYLFLIYHIPLCIISGNRFYHGMKYLSFSSNRRTFQGHFPLSMLLSASFSRYIATHLACSSALEWGKNATLARTLSHIHLVYIAQPIQHTLSSSKLNFVFAFVRRKSYNINSIVVTSELKRWMNISVYFFSSSMFFNFK